MFRSLPCGFAVLGNTVSEDNDEMELLPLAASVEDTAGPLQGQPLKAGSVAGECEHDHALSVEF